MKKMKFFIYALLAAAILTACGGSDGEVGPKGDKGDTGANGQTGADGQDGGQGDKGDKGDQGDPGGSTETAGFIQGTISGTRRDGTAFNEAFKYEYTHGLDTVTAEGNIFFRRFESLNDAIAFKLTKQTSAIMKSYIGFYGGLTPDAYDIGSVVVKLVKGLPDGRVFSLEARPHFYDETYDKLLELDLELMHTYNFVSIDRDGALAYAEYDSDNDRSNDQYEFTIQGIPVKHVYYSMDNGSLVSIDDNGEVVTSGPLFDKYNALKFVMNDELRMPVFVNAANDAPLWEVVGTIPADVFEITNFVNSDGVVSFDFSLTISKYRGYLRSTVCGFCGWTKAGENTSRHDITVTGKFNSGKNLYLGTVQRSRN